MKATEKVTVDGVVRLYDPLDVEAWLLEHHDQDAEEVDLNSIKATTGVESGSETWLVSWEEHGERIFLYGQIAPIEGEWDAAN